MVSIVITESDSNTGAYYVSLNSWFRAALFVLYIIKGLNFSLNFDFF